MKHNLEREAKIDFPWKDESTINDLSRVPGHW